MLRDWEGCMARVQYEAIFASNLMEPMLVRTMAASWANILIDHAATDVTAVIQDRYDEQTDQVLGHQLAPDAKTALKKQTLSGEVVLLLKWSFMGRKDFRLAFNRNKEGSWQLKIAPTFKREIDIARGWLTIARQNTLASKISKMTQEMSSYTLHTESQETG